LPGCRSSCQIDPHGKLNFAAALDWNRLFEWIAVDSKDPRAHQHCSLGVGYWSLLGAVGGFDQVNPHLSAGFLSCNHASIESEFGASYDHSDAGCAVVNCAGPALLIPPAHDLLSHVGGVRLVPNCLARNHDRRGSDRSTNRPVDHFNLSRQLTATPGPLGGRSIGSA
jgi:hypothetical protein